MTIRFDIVKDLRETVTYRVFFENETVSETFDCSTLVGNSATLGTPRLELFSVASNVDKHISLFNVSVAGTESICFSAGLGSSSISFNGGVEDTSGEYSSVVKIASDNSTTGYMIMTFIKKGGFEDIGRHRRKPNRPNPYS
jgi:hypothetical protein